MADSSKSPITGLSKWVDFSPDEHYAWRKIGKQGAK
jgi:hypothetical protein